MNKWDKRFLEMAAMVASWSKDPSTQTGAVIVRPDKSVASVGFNGFPSVMPDAEHHYNNREEKYSRIVHCEMNAASYAQDASLKGYTLYTYPFLSCDRCFVYMTQLGITRFVSPKCPAEPEERWGEVFAKVRKYADECGLTIDEYEI